MGSHIHVLISYDREADTGVCRACGPVPLKYRGESPRCGVARTQQRGLTNRHARSRKELRDAIRELKLARGCTDCGYREHWAALEFDHLPGTVKVMAIASMVDKKKSWSVIQAEIEKCEVVCANCHRIRTVTRLTTT